MFERIYNILVLFLGESKQGFYSKETEQYQFCCPSCAEENGGVPDNKFNLEVLLSETEGMRFHCWKCGDTNGMKGNVSKLIKRYGGKELYKEYKECVQELINSKMYNIEAFTGFTETLKLQNEIKLPKTFKKIDISTCKNKQLLSYLSCRKIDQKFIDRFNLGYTEWDGEDYAFRNRIIIPSYDSFGDLNYFIGRDYTGKGKIKYRNSDADKKEIIFQESLVDWDAPIYLCEGAFDAMRFPLNGISMLGKSLAKDSMLYNALYNKANSTITIVLDGDTTEKETKRIYKLLNFGRLKGKIRYINMSRDCKYKDMSELYENDGKQGVIQLLRKQQQYSELEIISE